MPSKKQRAKSRNVNKSYEEKQMSAVDNFIEKHMNPETDGEKAYRMKVLIKSCNLIQRTYTKDKGYEIFTKPVGMLPDEIQEGLNKGFYGIRDCIALVNCVKDRTGFVGKKSSYVIYDDGAICPIGEVDLLLDMTQ